MFAVNVYQPTSGDRERERRRRRSPRAPIADRSRITQRIDSPERASFVAHYYEQIHFLAPLSSRSSFLRGASGGTSSASCCGDAAFRQSKFLVTVISNGYNFPSVVSADCMDTTRNPVQLMTGA